MNDVEERNISFAKGWLERKRHNGYEVNSGTIIIIIDGGIIRLEKDDWEDLSSFEKRNSTMIGDGSDATIFTII
ncbi:hypothetical protein A2209_01440 [Candidatus Roizmanbacteria bacterium RIFOXYA1_FULL_41_12]|uniref:Uncharacterized protein n=2 Tax=Microgenomates group TaxID=1794810 RepID=A0A1F5F681_9BACT|nr:MAG: hypothetical protein UX32_C0031G0008 [Microgenomates group bacterium GW2011_GWF1_46_12]OGD74824.1 MAG: hypothetical protein A2228_00065 [Candidatus Collierbacteria bacterium RIFOXYA2_FULL_46_10]OGK67090.1 MAG: hypothetical protein A2209_01440 [Candidatus Roizmanbacteria bacterium RIFOXYA1_FULL_41_12]HBD02442.1 hypothetical protein [Candidatus Collierbacteria bacterium]